MISLTYDIIFATAEWELLREVVLATEECSEEFDVTFVTYSCSLMMNDVSTADLIDFLESLSRSSWSSWKLLSVGWRCFFLFMLKTLAKLAEWRIVTWTFLCCAFWSSNTRSRMDSATDFGVTPILKNPSFPSSILRQSTTDDGAFSTEGPLQRTPSHWKKKWLHYIKAPIERYQCL